MMYSAGTPFPVYCKPCWWSDQWSAKTYARDFDPQQPFFEQMKELMYAVPRPGVIHQGFSTNSDYTNRVTDMKNCYLIFGTASAEQCRYGTWVNGSKECQDCFSTIKSEKCYECSDCTHCYDLRFSRECTNCRNSWFLQNCFNCSDCFGCVNLRNKQYCMFNKQFSKEEYEKVLVDQRLDAQSGVDKARQDFAEFKKQFMVPALVTRRSVNSSGNWLEDCKNVSLSFNCQNVEEARHCYAIFSAKDVMDYSQWGAVAERIYEAVNCGIQVARLKFSHECWTNMTDSEYIMNCHSSKNLFGCIGLRNSEHCILNKQYTKEEYEKLVGQIKQQMDDLPYVDTAGRVYKYGEFYPIELSPHTYNESIAQEFYPITPAEAAHKKFPWKENEQKKYAITLLAEKIPDAIKDAPDSILAEIIGCEHAATCNQQCTGAFKIIPEELAMYRAVGLPLPRFCHNCRHFERLKERNPFKLWKRNCQCIGNKSEARNTPASPRRVEAGKSETGYQNNVSHKHGEKPCQNKFETSYAPDRPEKVYCIECYQAEVA